MGDNLPAIWERPAHTSAKHEILQAYLEAWIPIMARQSERMGATTAELLFVDGFAGPGCYSGGEDGSPILAIKSVLNHSLPIPVPVSFLFVEEDKERCAILEANVEKLKREIEKSSRIKVYPVEQGDCEKILNAFFDERQEQHRPIGPALFFLDQCGFSDVSMGLIARIMCQPLCEVFSYLNWDHMSRFLSDESKWSAIDRAFGGNQWRPVLNLEHRERTAFMLRAYKATLMTSGRSKHVWQFAMCDDDGKLLYWLFFCTNNLRGLEEMKKAMWKVDRSGGFRFSDSDDPSQLHLFTGYTERVLADELSRHFEGKIRTVGQVKEFVLTETPAYLFRRCLSLMEKEERLRLINAPSGRRKGTFPDENMRIQFLACAPA